MRGVPDFIAERQIQHFAKAYGEIAKVHLLRA
jgi:hypothetical protein